MSFKGYLERDSLVPLPSAVLDDSPAHLLAHVAGRHIDNQVNLTGAGAQVVNLFSVTGACRLLELSFHVTAATDSTTFSGVKFQLDDGTAQTDITTVVDGSGCLAGAVFVKTNTAANPLIFIDNAAGSFLDAILSSALAECFVQQKSATATYVQLVFTGDGATDIDISAECHFVPMSDTSEITAA